MVINRFLSFKQITKPFNRSILKPSSNPIANRKCKSRNDEPIRINGNILFQTRNRITSNKPFPRKL
jgi:hypothetical protein